MHDENLIGRLKSDCFTFTSGNIYFNNSVVKIRYDLLDKRDSMLTADQVFDFYDDVLNLDENRSVQQGTPIESK